jgi:uncharacterized protein
MKRTLQFFLIAILITWIFWIPSLLSKLNIWPYDVPDWFYLFGGLGPISAALIMSWSKDKSKGIRHLFASILIWKVKYYWFLVVLFLPLFMHFLIIILEVAIFDLPSEDISINVFAFFPAVFFTALFMLVEELGWRGYALPNLQKSLSALSSSLIIGLAWGIWHIPLLFYRPEQFGLHLVDSELLFILLYITNTMALSVVFTWIFNSTKGSLLLCTLFHGSLNTAGNTYSIPGNLSPIHYWAGLTTILIIVGVIIILLTNSRTLSKKSKIIWF